MLAGADLGEADLTGAQLGKADLSAVRAHGARLHGATLVRTDLDGADLTDADLSRAYLVKTDLSGADLSRADLTEADLHLVFVAGSVWDGTSARDARGTVAGPDVVVTLVEAGTATPAPSPSWSHTSRRVGLRSPCTPSAQPRPSHHAGDGRPTPNPGRPEHPALSARRARSRIGTAQDPNPDQPDRRTPRARRAQRSGIGPPGPLNPDRRGLRTPLGRDAQL